MSGKWTLIIYDYIESHVKYIIINILILMERDVMLILNWKSK